MSYTAPSDELVHILGSEDATTCHIIIIRHSGGGATALTHYDGHGLEELITDMVDDVKQAAMGHPEGRLEIHIFGGFDDPRSLSKKTTKDILAVLHLCNDNLHLMTACITELNNCYRDGVPFPVVYGVGVDVRTGKIFPATFPEKGPEVLVRHAQLFDRAKPHNIYNRSTKQLVIGPFDWYFHNSDWFENMLAKPDNELMKVSSTSPAQEPASFLPTMKSTFRFLIQNTDSMAELFSDGQPWRFKKLPSGEWQRL